MRAITVAPGTAGSLEVRDVPEPEPALGSILVQALALGICGTDREIAGGEYGWAPEGRDRLVLGHESLGRVLEAPADAPVAEGDVVVGIVRRPDPAPCSCCAVGRFDMCRTGDYTERGIKSIDGYGSERWRIEPGYVVGLDPGLESTGVLLEPTSVVAKAWDRVDEVMGATCAPVRSALVTGAGPIGLLAAMIAAQRGLETHVLDRVTEGAKPDLVRDLGATYHAGSIAETGLTPDVIIECTGAGPLVFEAMRATAAPGVVCLTGVSPSGRRIPVDAGALNTELVLQNDVVVGSVNASRDHYEAAAQALARADRGWLERLITRRIPLEECAAAFEPAGDDIKAVVTF
jgi:glucose 1-dehydrogenase